MKPIPRLIVSILEELGTLLGRVLSGREKRPARRLREVWTRHEAKLAKLAADEAAATKFGDD